MLDRNYSGVDQTHILVAHREPVVPVCVKREEGGILSVCSAGVIVRGAEFV